MDIIVTVSGDEKKALIRIETAGPNDKPVVQTSELRHALENAGVVFGIKEKWLDLICDQKKYNANYTIAEAKPPKDGNNGEIVVLKKPKERSTYDKGVDADKKVDHFGEREGFITIIKENEPIAEYKPPTKGIKGTSVLGNPIDSKAGKDIKWQTIKGRNTRIEGNKLVAEIDGALSRIDHYFHIDKSLEIKGHLGMRTGSIVVPLDADMKLTIEGDIKSGFTAQCKHIEVFGLIEDSVITAKELEVKGGIVGTSTKPIKADMIKAGFISGPRKISARYLEVEREISGGTMIDSDFVKADIIQESTITALYGVWTKHLLGSNRITLGIDINEDAEYREWTKKMEDIESLRMKTKASNQALLKKGDKVKEMAARNPQNPALSKELEKLKKVSMQLRKLDAIKAALEKKLTNHASQMYVKEGSFLLTELGFSRGVPKQGEKKPVNNITIKECSYDKRIEMIPGMYVIKGEEIAAVQNYSLPEITNLAGKYLEAALKENTIRTES